MIDAMEAGTVMIPGAGGDEIEAYLARPTGVAAAGGVVVIHHLPGYDEQTKEIARRFAAHDYLAICPEPVLARGPGRQPRRCRRRGPGTGRRPRRAPGR